MDPEDAGLLTYSTIIVIQRLVRYRTDRLVDCDDKQKPIGGSGTQKEDNPFHYS